MREQKRRFTDLEARPYRCRGKDSQAHTAYFDNEGILFNLGNFSAEGCDHISYYMSHLHLRQMQVLRAHVAIAKHPVRKQSPVSIEKFHCNYKHG
jgi:hypothetical protein